MTRARSLFAVPWLREAFRFRPEVMVGPEASRWSPLELVGAGYLGLVLFAALRHLVRWARLRRVLLGAETADETLKEEVFARARLVGVSAPMVLVSGAVAVPFVAGALWPSLVWAAGLLAQLTLEQRGLVIQHELSHLSRGDHRVGPVLSMFELAFPFHPTASRLMRELALAREVKVETFEVSVRPNVSGKQVVTVELGKKTTVKVNGLTRAAIGNESVCELNARAGGVLELKGRSSGSTTLLVWDTNGQRRNFLVRVVAK